MDIVKELENGKCFITNNSIANVVMKACENIEGIFSFKKGKFVDCDIDNDKTLIKISVNVKKGIDIEKIYKIIQLNVSSVVHDILGVDNMEINVDFKSIVD